MVDASLEPSLFLAGHEKAHREHTHSINTNTRHHHNHNLQHVHKGLKPRQVATTIEQVNQITTVIQTVSYVQQIDVDSTGGIFSTVRILIDTTADSSTAAARTTPASLSNSGDVSASSTAPSSAASSAQPDSSLQSLLSISSTALSASSLTSTPSIPVTSNFPSLSLGTNSTTTPLILSSSSLSSTFSNSSTTSTRSSLSYLTSDSSSSSGTSTSSNFSSTTSSSSSDTLSQSSSSTQATATATDGSGGGVGGGAAGGASGTAGSGASPSSTGTAGSSSSGGSTTAPTPVIVGSVVGSVAGLAFLVMLLLLFVKWRKRKNMLSLGNGNDGGGSVLTSRELPPTQPAGAMSQRRSFAYAVPAALATLTGYNKRSSQRTDESVSTAPSERGFYRVSGRKLPSVLQTGGDGYGGESSREENTLSGASFYRDSTGFYGGQGATHAGPGPGSPLAASPIGMSTDRDSGVPVMRPSPARTPVTEHGPFGVPPPPPIGTPPPPLQPPRRPGQPDGLGRSLASQDGSHASRFTEEV